MADTKLIQLEIEGEGAVSATEQLLKIPDITGYWSPVDKELQRGGIINTIATIVSIATVPLSIAEKIYSWYQRYQQSSSKSIENVLIISPNGQRLLLSDATVEQICQILEDTGSVTEKADIALDFNVVLDEALYSDGTSDDEIWLQGSTEYDNLIEFSAHAGLSSGRGIDQFDLSFLCQSVEEFDSPCYVYAEMDERVILKRVTTLEVTVSGDSLEYQSGPAAQGGEVTVNAEKRLIVQVIPKTNFTVVEGDRAEVDPPKPGEQHQLYFDLRPTHLGEGEVWVIVRQGQMPLLTLSIKPQIVENRAQVRTPMPPSAAMSFMASAEVQTQSPGGRVHTKGAITEFPTSQEPLHQLRIIEKRNGDQVSYLYELHSPTLDLLQSFESKPITTDRYDYVEQIYREIESRWLNSADDIESFTAELRAFGGKLFDELFPEGLQSLLWQHRDQIQSIMVISTEPFVPWELVHLKAPGERALPSEMRFLGQMGLVRWLYDAAGYPPQTIQIRQGRAHYVIPQYPLSKLKLAQAEQEYQFLEQTFAATSVEPQLSPVRRLLEAGNFDLLHFAGHGQAEGNSITHAKLLLQGRIESNKYIPAELSATTVEQFSRLRSSDNRPIVVLNACQIGREGYTLTSIGGFAQAFIKGGAGAFVGPLWSVGDRPARIFTETFYTKLLEGSNLAEATKQAREQAQRTGDATWLAYAVYGHPHLTIKCLK